jgi:hypothetical protein
MGDLAFGNNTGGIGSSGKTVQTIRIVAELTTYD